MKKILLIEDNKDVRENTAEILQLSNYEVITASDGKEGVERATSDRPDLIICDIMMPVLDGYGVLHLLGKNKETAAIPFIFLTAKADRVDVRKGMEMGADDYITKPFDDIELLKAVEARLRKAEIVHQEFASTKEGIYEFVKTAKEVQKLDRLSEKYEARQYKRKQVIYELGTKPYHLYFLQSGKIKVVLINEDGKELITDIIGAGEFFGYSSLFEETLYTDTAITLEDSEVLLIPKSEFSILVNNDSSVASRFIRMLANNLKEKEDQLLRLAYDSVRKRVADALLFVYRRYKISSDDKPQLQITREDLANVVGTATASVIRCLSEFRQENLIDIKDGKITILNEQKLAGLIN